MKKRLIALLLCISMLTVFVSCSKKDDTTNSGGVTEGAAAKDPGLKAILDYGKLKVGCKTDVPCFGMQNTSTGEFEGLEIDIAYEVAGKIFGVTAQEAKEKGLCEFQGVTAKTRGALLDNGEINLVAATFTITEERKNSWNFSTPYIQDALGLMSLASAGYKTMNDIDGAIVGVAQGATTKDAIANYIKEQNLPITVEYQEFDGYPALSAALAAGNIDIFSVDRAILAGYNDDTTFILPERFGTQDYGIATALYATELTKLVDEVVSDLVDSGKMTEMITGWGIE